MKEIQAIGVYCSSYDSVSDVYKKAAVTLGEELAKRKITLVYGGGNLGLMGQLANTTMKEGGRVIGYMPEHLKNLEEPNWGITEMHMVDSMHTRKRLMFEQADGFFVLPGGFGTLDEAFEIITWRQLGLHEKPVIFININEYWTPLQDLTKNIFEQHFAKSDHKKYFQFAPSIPEAFQFLLKVKTPSTHEPVAEWV
jgi:uncharacterized protein (TIGR00730 family)